MKTLLITYLNHANLSRDEQRRRELADEIPNVTYFNDLNATDIMDEAYMSSIGGVRGKIYRRLPGSVAQALEAYRLRNQYDAVITWDDHLALLYSLLLTGTHARSRHIAILIWMMENKKRLLIRVAQRHIDHMVVFGDLHRDLLEAFSGVPRAKITSLPTPVDVEFWRPEKGAAAACAANTPASEFLCAVSCSKHDYQTLMDAMRELPMTCRMVAVDPHSDDTRRLYNTKAIPADVEIPANVICGPCTAAELRPIYSKARFVVVPVAPSFVDYGTTTVTEAMAMGKAVICTRTYNLMNMVEPGVTGLLVPPEDPQALRDAIQYLWDNPEVAERMGAEARRRAEAYDVKRFSACVKQAIEATIQASPAKAPAAGRLARVGGYTTALRTHGIQLASKLRAAFDDLRWRAEQAIAASRSAHGYHLHLDRAGASASPSPNQRVADTALDTLDTLAMDTGAAGANPASREASSAQPEPTSSPR